MKKIIVVAAVAGAALMGCGAKPASAQGCHPIYGCWLVVEPHLEVVEVLEESIIVQSNCTAELGGIWHYGPGVGWRLLGSRDKAWKGVLGVVGTLHFEDGRIEWVARYRIPTRRAGTYQIMAASGTEREVYTAMITYEKGK